MAQSGNVSVPGGFGGLVRYNEEYNSRFKLTPQQVLVFIAGIIIFVMALNIFR